MIKNLQYDFYQTGSSVEKVIVAIHGWQGDRKSMKPIMKNMKIPNVGWFFMQAPYPVNKGNG